MGEERESDQNVKRPLVALSVLGHPGEKTGIDPSDSTLTEIPAKAAPAPCASEERTDGVPLPRALLTYCTAPGADYAHPSADEDLREFLEATLDEVRLHYAEEYAAKVLKAALQPEAVHLRRYVLRRELSNKVDYQRHRDHAAHTLHNYLLGFWLYSHSNLLKDSFKADFLLREPTTEDDEDDAATSNFKSLWPIPSLLHDIGYMFEGTLDPLSTALSAERAGEAARALEEYFRLTFWHELGFRSQDQRRAICDWARIEIPCFGDGSLASIADSLRYLGDIEAMRNTIADDISVARARQPENIEQPYALSRDAFELWRSHYRTYGKDSMVDRVNRAETSFNDLLTLGMPLSGTRLLDHGVVSGLVTLMGDTLYTKLHFADSISPPSDPFVQRLLKQFKESRADDGYEYHPRLWYSIDLWTSAASALHNIPQILIKTDKAWPLLAVEEDPLCYLGILVDVLQEWDRYSTSREVAITGLKLPLQAKDVRLSVDGPIPAIIYPKDRAAGISETLKLLLKDWEKIVEVREK